MHFTGYVPVEDLPAIYNLGELFVFPSVYEGFGLPVVEAMACGTPVITSNTSSLDEIAGGAAETVDPYDTDALAAAIVAAGDRCRTGAEISRERGLARARDVLVDADRARDVGGLSARRRPDRRRRRRRPSTALDHRCAVETVIAGRRSP